MGGTWAYWETVNFKFFDTATIVLLNLSKCEVPENCHNVISVVGDATDLHQYADKSFDLVFSNSVIEHLGSYDAQEKMAAEMMRVGKHYYLQTPNRYFLDPHTMFPFYQFFPVKVKAFLIRRMRLGFTARQETDEEAMAFARSIRLLTGKELKTLFPNAELHKEKFLLMTKSYTLWG